MAFCSPPDKDGRPEFSVKALTGDCLDSTQAPPGATYVAARVTDEEGHLARATRKRRHEELDLNQPAPQEETAEQQEGDFLLSIGDKLTSRPRRETDSFQTSVDAEAGHMYKACLQNRAEEALVLHIFFGPSDPEQ